jgi:hypothetical protein
MPPRRVVTALYIVYDADGTRAGELLYMLRKAMGIAHCAACDITHGPRVEKPEFTALKSTGWSVPMHNIHRDEMHAALAASVGATLPVVAAATDDGGYVVLLNPRQLDDCEGMVPVLERSVNAALAGAGLFLPPFPPTRRRSGGGAGEMLEARASSSSASGHHAGAADAAVGHHMFGKGEEEEEVASKDADIRSDDMYEDNVVESEDDVVESDDDVLESDKVGDDSAGRPYHYHHQHDSGRGHSMWRESWTGVETRKHAAYRDGLTEKSAGIDAARERQLWDNDDAVVPEWTR